jgi:hypothetical protein
VKLRLAILVAALTSGVAVAIGAPAPVLFQTAPGRFEIAAVDTAASRRVMSLAEEAWPILGPALQLPARFSSPVFVRLIPPEAWSERVAFRARAEPGGIVSVQLVTGEAMTDELVRRALVDGLLLRLAVAQHGTSTFAAVPRWLEQGIADWWRTRIDGAQLDELKQESAHIAPPSLAQIFGWQNENRGSRAISVGAVWLFTWLQTEGSHGEWLAFLRRVLAGEEPGAALTASYPGRFTNNDERELWWQTGWHDLRRVRTLPLLEAEESRAALAELARFVFLTGDRDVVGSLRDALAHGRETFIGTDVQRRAAELHRLVPVLHPFYRNAGLSLAAAFAAVSESAAKQATACASFERDWRDATELETAANAALDALEKNRGSDRAPVER